MSDTTLQPQAGNPAGQAPTGQPAAQPQQAAAPTGQEPNEGLSLAATQAELTKARQEAAKYRTERNAFEADLKKRQEAEMTEGERLKARATELETQATQAANELRQERANRMVEREARKLSIIDEETALALVQHKIEYDDKGQPTNVTELLTALAKDKPFLVTQPGAGAGAGARQPAASAANPNRGGPSVGTFTESQIQDREFYEANRDAIMKAYKEGRIIRE